MLIKVKVAIHFHLNVTFNMNIKDSTSRNLLHESRQFRQLDYVHSKKCPVAEDANKLIRIWFIIS